MTADTASNNNNNANNNNNNNNANKNYNTQTTTASSSLTTTTTTTAATARLNTTASHAFNNSINDSAVAQTTTTTTIATPESPTTTIELSENFYISNKRKNNVKIQVKLNVSGIFLRRETKENDQVLEQHIRLEDIIGSRCGTRIKKRARGGLVSCKSLQDDDQQQQQQQHTQQPQKSQSTTQLGQHIRREELDKKTLKSSSSSSQHNSKHSADASDNSAYLYIYAYVKRDKPLRRVQTIRILRFRTHNSYAENLLVAERWHHGIRMLKSQGRQMENNHLLVLLNPKSGSGKGRELFQKQVAPVLKEANVQYDLQVTTHSNYAREFIRSRRDLLQRYSGIVVASGDGLFYEVLNGLMERDDWRLLSRKMPIGIIPCGSGNGLAKSIAHCYNEPYEPKPILTATLACVSGNTTPMDIVRIEVARSGKHAVMWSFLSVGWGLIADIDIESEKLRSIGSPRFTLWSIHRLISLRTYKGKLSYLPWVGPPKLERTESQPETPFAAARETERERQGEFFDLPDIDEEFQDFEGANNDDDDDFVDARSLDGTSYRTHVDSWHSAMSRRTAYYSLAGQSTRSSQSVTASMYSKIEAANAELEQRAPVTNIPPLNMPLDAPEWKHEDGEFVMVQAAYTTHLASDCHFAPNSKLNDGIIYLVIIRGGVGRSQLLQFLLNLSSGTHLPEQPNEFITVLPVRAFRIVPSGNEGILTVDGERVEYGPIQGELFPSMINVMVPNASEAEEQQAIGSSDEEDNDNDSEEQQRRQD